MQRVVHRRDPGQWARSRATSSRANRHGPVYYGRACSSRGASTSAVPLRLRIFTTTAGCVNWSNLQILPPAGVAPRTCLVDDHGTITAQLRPHVVRLLQLLDKRLPTRSARRGPGGRESVLWALPSRPTTRATRSGLPSLRAAIPCRSRQRVLSFTRVFRLIIAGRRPDGAAVASAGPRRCSHRDHRPPRAL